MAGRLVTVTVQFQSTLSMRRATNPRTPHPFVAEFQSTLSMRRATWRGSFLFLNPYFNPRSP